MRNNNFIPTDFVIKHITNLLRTYTGTPLRDFTNGTLKINALSSEQVTTTLQLSGKDVLLTSNSKLFKSIKLKVGKVNDNSIYVSGQLAMIAGLQIYRVLAHLKTAEDVLSLFSIRFKIDTEKEAEDVLLGQKRKAIYDPVSAPLF